MLNWRLAVPLLALAVAFTVLTVLVMSRAEGMQRAVERHYSDVAETASDALGNVAVVQSFARIELEVSYLRSLVNSLLRAQMPVLSWWALAAVLTRTATTLTLLVILLLGTWFKLDGLVSVGEIVSFMAIATLLIARLEQVVGFANRLFMDLPKLAEFFAVLDTVPAVRDRPDAVDPGRVRGLVEFRDVSFSYDGKRPAVADLSFTALPASGSRWSAQTGSGKTTALALLHRAFDPQSGDSSPSTAWTFAASRLPGCAAISASCSRRRCLFNRSIAENLRVGKPDATDDELRAAAARGAGARIHRPQRAAASKRAIGERGRLLSGGERQRLAIARALLKDPPILILDEATSALDPVTEARLNPALDEVMKGRTTFVIAHRLVTIRNATRILVFSKGASSRPAPTTNWCSAAAFSPRWCGRNNTRWRKKKCRRSRPPSGAAGGNLTFSPPRGRGRKKPSAQPLQDAHIIGDRGAAHVEDAAEPRVLDLHVAGGAGELHGRDRVHRHAGRADSGGRGVDSR